MKNQSLAIIPARGGSKRIPFKNGMEFCGKPMMVWPIERARASGVFDRILVSTDDPALAEIARGAGAEVPFMRDASLADDHTGTTEVIRDAIKRLDMPADATVACLYPTAVFATAKDLAQARQRLESGGRNWVFAVGEFRAPILRSYRRSDNGIVANWPEHMPKRSQDLPPAFFDAGQFYFARASTWTTPGSFPWDGADAVVFPADRCIDIDTLDDLALAEVAFRRHFVEEASGLKTSTLD